MKKTAYWIAYIILYPIYLIGKLFLILSKIISIVGYLLSFDFLTVKKKLLSIMPQLKK